MCEDGHCPHYYVTQYTSKFSKFFYLLTYYVVNDQLGDVVGGRRQCQGQGRQQTATSRGRLAQAAKPPSSRIPPPAGIKRPPATAGGASLWQDNTSETGMSREMNDDHGHDDDDDEVEDEESPAAAQQQQHSATDETQRTQNQNNNRFTESFRPPVSGLSFIFSLFFYLFLPLCKFLP